jgi:hypothetical protein
MHILKKNVQLMINILYIIDNNSLQELPIFLNPLIQRSLELRDNEFTMLNNCQQIARKKSCI